MSTTPDDIKLLKKIGSNMPQSNKNFYNKKSLQGKTLSPLKRQNTNIPFKDLNFNPLSFISYKYSPKTLMLMNRKKINLEDKENLLNSKKNTPNINNEDKIEYIYSINTKKIKLKPLNKNRSSSQLIPKNDDIFIPSQKTSQELINYNMSNTHNTLLNYYHKNHKNLKIINFIRTNSCDPNYLSSSMNKSDSLNNKSIFNNSRNISRNEISTHFQNNDTFSPLSKTIKNPTDNISYFPKEYQKIGCVTTKKNKQKNKNRLIIDYDSEIYSKVLPHNLRFFANHFFEEEKKEITNRKNSFSSNRNKNEKEKENEMDFFKSRNNSNINYQIVDFKGKKELIATNLTNRSRKPTYLLKNNKNEDFHHIMKNPFEKYSNIGEKVKYNPLEHNDLANKIQQLILNPNTSQVRNNPVFINNKINNENKNITFKEIRNISKKGFEKMKADKFRRFNMLVNNTNKEVIQLEKKLDELLEENKRIFFNAKDDDMYI